MYFPGDTDLFPQMAELEDIDIALFPIGGWGPTVGEGHLDPTRAVRATELVQPRLVVPIHWGTYSPVSLRRGAPGWLRDPLRRFESELDRRRCGDRLGPWILAGARRPAEDRRRPSPGSDEPTPGLA